MSDQNQRGMASELLRKLVESEINAGFIFVDVARGDYKAAKFPEGNAALSKAEAIYAQASELAREVSIKATADRLRELRSAIDILMSGMIR